jgi:hypothetical protein
VISCALSVAANQSGQANVLVAPIASLVGALVGALIAGGFRISGDKAARRAESQREALYELQEKALTLRRELGRYGRLALPTPSNDDLLDAAFGDFEARLQRVLCETVRDQAAKWQALAPGFFTNDPEITFAQENAAWTTLQEFVGEELRRLDR